MGDFLDVAGSEGKALSYADLSSHVSGHVCMLARALGEDRFMSFQDGRMSFPDFIGELQIDGYFPLGAKPLTTMQVMNELEAARIAFEGADLDNNGYVDRREFGKAKGSAFFNAIPWDKAAHGGNQRMSWL